MVKFATISALLSLAFADDIPSCGSGQDACPEEYPCCSTDGTCGNGYVCLGGCDPRYSYTTGSCVAMPIYDNGTYTFNGTDDIATYADYLGDAEKNPFSYYGNITSADDSALRVQMYESSGASTVSSSYYMWYGKVTVRMKTSGGAGVVSDFILLSNVKDEIDYEFVGYNMTDAQSNYYWHGEEDYKNMVECAVSSDTEENYHNYTIDWTEDSITWSIDGVTKRTLNKADTLNSTSGEYVYPQTPARIQFGLWAGGDSSAQGTSEWAGGKIDWSSGQAGDVGYFYMDVESIDVELYTPPSGTTINGTKSYVYTSKSGLSSDIALTDEDYVLEATDGTGDDLAGPYGTTSSSASSSAASSSTASSSRASSSASKSSASSSSASSSAVSSSSASSSAKPSSPASSSAKSSSSASSSAKSSSSVKPSSSSSVLSSSSSVNSTSSAQSSSRATTSSSAVAAIASSEASTSSTPTSGSTSNSTSDSTTTSATSVGTANAAGQLVAPLFAAIIPAALMI